MVSTDTERKRTAKLFNDLYRNGRKQCSRKSFISVTMMVKCYVHVINNVMQQSQWADNTSQEIEKRRTEP